MKDHYLYPYNNKAHGLFFLLITSVLLVINYLGISLSNTPMNFVCLFLISIIGISHGALDNWKGEKVLKLYKIKNKLVFYFIYVLIAFLIIGLWVLAPSFTLTLFLLIAAYHFGKEDSYMYYFDKLLDDEPLFFNKKLDNLYFVLKGSIIILAPLCFHFDETLGIFKTLLVDSPNFINFLIYCNEHDIFRGAFTISAIVGLGLFIETFSIILLNFVFSPLIAFTMYFCFLHSIRHAVSLIVDLENEEDEVEKKLRKYTQINGKYIKMFIKKAAPLTLITAVIFILGVFLLTNYYSINDAILKVIFIGLASLTFPHILLEYLLEKNEKRT